MKGYKVFGEDWTCRDKQYTCPGEFEEDVKPSVCAYGMHFCTKASDCFQYYDFNPNFHVCEVEAYGDVDEGDYKCCTNKLRIIREVTWDEVLRIVNTGKNCTGLCNTGNWNTGNWNTSNWNTGNWNTGNCNTGDWNTGNCNTGDRNTGDCNTGNRNTGNCNTGNWNTGDWNTGDWNAASFSSGCFCTGDQKILMFNKPSEWTLRDWRDSAARYLLNGIQKDVLVWVYTKNMTEEEKAAHPEHETTGGYLKVLDESECAQMWWDTLSQERRQIIMDLPNFDAEIFRECTGIKV